jgi:hypothetical protein
LLGLSLGWYVNGLALSFCARYSYRPKRAYSIRLWILHTPHRFDSEVVTTEKGYPSGRSCLCMWHRRCARCLWAVLWPCRTLGAARRSSRLVVRLSHIFKPFHCPRPVPERMLGLTHPRLSVMGPLYVRMPQRALRLDCVRLGSAKPRCPFPCGYRHVRLGLRASHSIALSGGGVHSSPAHCL